MEISVITPVYNAQRFLEESARSALAQSETSELLLVDDGSTDGSLELCRRLADSDARVHALTHPQRKNLGPAATRNLGIEHARCEYIAFLDADDYFLPDRFRTARRLLENDSQVDGVYEAVRNFCDTPETQQWWRTSGEPDLYTFVEGVAPECLFEAMLQGKMGYFCTDGLTIRKRLLNKTGGFDTHLRWAEDTALWLKMAAVGRLVGGALSEPIAMRRVHGENTVMQNWGHYAEHRLEMFRELLRWRSPGRLSRSQRLQVFEAMVREWSWQIPRQRGWSSRRSRVEELLYLLRMGIRYPWAWQSGSYRSSLSHRTGLARIIRWWSRKRCKQPVE